MRNHFTLENFRRALRNPRLIQRELLRLGSLPFNHGYGYYTDRRLPQSTDVMDEDWDNLLILDACRYDYFANQHNFDGISDRVVSPGKMSWEFMQKTFQGDQFHDTIYITSNPFATRLSEDTFFKTLYLIDKWDDEIGTIHPEDVAEAAKRAHAQHPNKRLILHFMQPHRPYLGATAERLRERVDLVGYRNEGTGLQIWGAVKEGKVTMEEVRTAYSETLDIVLDVVDDFLKEIGGKSVITADHGEMLGERVFPFTSRVWGHSEGFSTRTLRQVPWQEVSGGTRRDVAESSPIVAEQKLKEDEVEDRLRALGYTE
jgi:hypothetical protein